MHESSYLRMAWFENSFARQINRDKIKILDVGSYDVNGSYQPIFSSSKYEYQGLDIIDGPNVHIVLDKPYDWGNIPTESFDIVISGQAFEHIEFFWITMTEMARILKKDGLICIIVPNGFLEHRFPVDCYRFFTDGMIALARYVKFDILHAHTNAAPNSSSSKWYSLRYADSMLVAKKPYAGEARIIDKNTYHCEPGDQVGYRSGFKIYEEFNGIGELHAKQYERYDIRKISSRKLLHVVFKRIMSRLFLST